MGTNTTKKVLTSWDDLIQDANRQIAAARQRIAELKKTIKSVERVRDAGTPVPQRSK